MRLQYQQPSDIIRCPNCKLNQYARADCRKCGEPLPTVPPVGNALRLYPSILSDLLPLPTQREMESMLATEAMRRANGNREEAAKLIGVGRTTMYRRVDALIREQGKAEAL